MQNFRTFGYVLLLLISMVSFALGAIKETPKVSPKSSASENQQQLVESVDIQGNRRNRDEDLLYYIQTRPGDVYNPQQLQTDLRKLLELNFFDKTATRVLTEPGARGGVNVIFEVRELPIIRDLQFVGAKAVPESDILKKFREERVGISKEATFNPANIQKANRVIRELLAGAGYPNAKIEVKEEEVSATSIALTFNVDQGNRSRIVEIDFEGNEVFSDGELRGALELVKETGLIARVKGQDILDLRKLQYDLQKNVRQYMYSKGYFQARLGDPEVVGLGYKRTGFPILGSLPLPLVSSKDDTLKIIVPVTEGRIFRAGEIKVEGNSIFSEQQILAIVGLQKGEIVDGKRLTNALSEDLPKYYGSQGFVQFSAEPEPEFKDNPSNPKEGIVDVKIIIDEGKQFRLRRLEFSGNTFTRDRVLRREVIVNEGDIYNQLGIERSVLRLNQTGYFDPIDKDKDVEIRTDEEQGDVDLVLKVKERGRQQIQFNGGVSGIGGSFFGLEYSTNNLVGRGETLSLNLGFGNRQRSFQLTFQEPYFRDRPITVGVSLFGSSYKFFGEGTFLSQNNNVIGGALDPNGLLLTDSDNLFTQNTYGASIFATAPLSELLFKKRAFTQFSRLGLTYSFSATSIKDPPVNQSADITQRIPILYEQPNIITSRVTGSFVYDSREPSANGIDIKRGSQFSAQIALAGLGGDVRTYQPSLSFSSFIPIRRKRSPDPEVFAFRILAGTIGSFAQSAKIRDANSLSFINGVPIYERYYLGTENDIRGYQNREIGPLATIATGLTTRNVVVATNAVGNPEIVPGLTDAQRAVLTNLGTFTGLGGANPILNNAFPRFIGGDTQLLGNFEYRVPIFGPVTLAAFADVGTVFNLRKGGIKQLNTSFQPDQPFLGSGNINNTLLFRNIGNNDFFAQNPLTGAFLLLGGNPLSYNQYNSRYCSTDTNSDGKIDLNDCPAEIPTELTQVFLRGDAQQNTQVDIGNSAFARFKDFRASVGLELRVQVPVVNVPFRLIYYYNPNGKFGVTDEVPGIFLPGKRSGFRFTVGRTF